MSKGKTKLLIFMPVAGRIIEVKRTLAALNDVDWVKYNIRPTLMVVVDHDHDFTMMNSFSAVLRMPVMVVMAPMGLSLSSKKNYGISCLIRTDGTFIGIYDYIMELDSTGAISHELLDLYVKEFESGTPFFGVNRIAFHDLVSNRWLNYSIMNSGVWVSGRCIRYDVMVKTWQYYGTLWQPDLNNGLGVDQENRIQHATGNIVHIVPTVDPLLYDAKTGQDVTPFRVLAEHRKESQEITSEREKKRLWVRFFGFEKMVGP